MNKARKLLYDVMLADGQCSNKLVNEITDYLCEKEPDYNQAIDDAYEVVSKKLFQVKHKYMKDIPIDYADLAEVLIDIEKLKESKK